ncbi:tetratricopeptide repeat protein [Acinetobacter johnsonii]|uniref:Tetratricopeptide repeat protein n=1 Tax=Acinetobacter johnsonii TaxID=40214 RepID=A0AA42MV93_ACIJO|nr:tetratricopeptide repeat protein [Acinetobacter johnsonii]MDH0970470.1 tetratricopeptide repeat protein [Acinetobacter johnsonii]
MYKKYYSIIIFFFILVLTVFVYWTGLQGNFLFDDYPNLQDLGTYGVIDSWDKVRNFISNGFSGPTGRPISLLSFLIDANTWPASPYSFKYTNLMIHLLNGVLLYWAILLLLKNYNYKESKSIWIALVASAIWLLHPYFVSTTLYVVQRMAQLATLFSLVGIVGYLKCRLSIPFRPVRAYIGMVFFLGLGTVFATYSKENGALLPFLILVIEFCNPNKMNRPIWQWRAFFLWLPSIAILVVLSKYITFAEDPWPNRNFNMIERLYSESRILCEYLFNLLIPQVELRGLYQDAFIVSKSIFNPITTLYSIVFLLALLFLALFFKKRYPLFALGILFFLTAHLMESTVIGLELYFEHRNYLAAIFLFLPIVSGLALLKDRIDARLVNLIVIFILGGLSFFTYERAKLWGNTPALELYWAQNSPNSPRAQSSIAGMLFDQGRVLEANLFLETAIQRMPESALLNMRLLLQKVYSDIATEQDFTITSQMLRKQPFDAQAVQALRNLVEYITEQHKTQHYGQWTLQLINELETNNEYKNYPVFQRLMPYLKAKIYLEQGNVEKSLKYYSDAIILYNDVEAGMMMVSELATHGNMKEALVLLNTVETIYKKQEISTLKRSSKEYDFEIGRIRVILEDQLNEHKS